MPAFGPIGAYASSDEPHAGFKVFVANDDRKGLAWMVVLHQGSGSPRRGTVRFHSLEAWLFKRRGRRLLAHTRMMADFGDAMPNCPGTRARAQHAAAARPRLQVRLRGVGYRARRRRRAARQPGLRDRQRDHAVRSGRPERIVFNKGFACGPHDPAGWDSYCKGDKRTVFHPRWVVRNRGRSRFRTDAYGRRAPPGSCRWSRAACGWTSRASAAEPENAFVMERPSDGGIYRAGRGLNSSNFEFPGLLRAPRD